MAGTKQYFRLVQTAAGSQDDVRRLHEEKLNNYARYKYPEVNEKLPPGIETWVVPDFEIKHTNTSTTTKDYIFIITTSLCCEDKEPGGEY